MNDDMNEQRCSNKSIIWHSACVEYHQILITEEWTEVAEHTVATSNRGKCRIVVNYWWFYFLVFFVQMTFQAFGAKKGALHGLLVRSPYVTKDHLQLKRLQAQNSGTTYIYDFPELFRQVTNYFRFRGHFWSWKLAYNFVGFSFFCATDQLLCEEYIQSCDDCWKHVTL